MFDKPLRDGDDVSWLPWARPGDNQGVVGACSVFAIANCMEIILETEIGNHTCIDTYKKACRAIYGKGDCGLFIPEAFKACQDDGIVPAEFELHQEKNLKNLYLAPMVATYSLTVGWQHTNSAGCPDHKAHSVRNTARVCGKYGGWHDSAFFFSIS
jgi:hypothetical protein